VSPGCKFCYAEVFSERFRGVPGHAFEHGFDLRLVPEKLEQPLHWRRPRKIFVNSMSDLFHEDVPADYIGRVGEVMRRAHWHLFQVLTKRDERLRELLQGELRVVNIRRQCRAQRVPFFFKQWGGTRKHETGRTLDGRTYDEFPLAFHRVLAASNA
jgi:protein gp37